MGQDRGGGTEGDAGRTGMAGLGGDPVPGAPPRTPLLNRRRGLRFGPTGGTPARRASGVLGGAPVGYPGAPNSYASTSAINRPLRSSSSSRNDATNEFRASSRSCSSRSPSASCTAWNVSPT